MNLREKLINKAIETCADECKAIFRAAEAIDETEQLTQDIVAAGGFIRGTALPPGGIPAIYYLEAVAAMMSDIAALDLHVDYAGKHCDGAIEIHFTGKRTIFVVRQAALDAYHRIEAAS